MGIKETDKKSQPQLFSAEETENQLPKRTKLLTAVVIFYGNLTFGCAFNSYGPVITSLQTKYETDDATISRVFTILTGCYMIGALIGGIIYNHVNRQLAVIGILSMMAAMTFLTPFCPTMTLFFITAAVMGLCCGSYDAAQFVWMMEMMQKDCPPYVQAQQLFYAVGTNLPALIMAPFLDDPVTSTTTGKSGSESDYYDKLFIPYSIIGLLISIAAFGQIVLFIFFRYHVPPPEILESDELSKEDVKPEVAKPFIGSWSWPKLRVVILSCAFYGAYQGMSMCTFQFFSKFGQNSELHLSESEAAYVLTGMTAAYAVGRGVAIIAVLKVSNQFIICVNLLLVTISNVMLIGWAIRSLPVLWACSILLGLGISSMYASFSAFIERYLYFTNFIGSLVPFCGSGVASVYPLVVGSFIEKNPSVLSYTCFFSIGLMIIAFGSVSYLTHKNKTRY